LKLTGHCAGGIATAIPDIEINAIPAARYGVPAAAILTTAVVAAAIAAIAVSLPIVALVCGLIFRSESAIGIAHAVTGAQIPAMAARRRMSISPVLDLLYEVVTRVRRRSG
jgi:hypothetical protein